MVTTSNYFKCDSVTYTIESLVCSHLLIFACLSRFMPEKAALLADRVLTELVKVCSMRIPRRYYFDLVLVYYYV